MEAVSLTRISYGCSSRSGVSARGCKACTTAGTAGVLFVRRRGKPAENAGQREKIRLELEILFLGDAQDLLNRRHTVQHLPKPVMA